jgi:hypothetical protein
MIDSQTDVGGWPQLFTATVPVDSDQDGMPDAWEISQGLNPLDPEDRNTIGAGGYTQLEIYLNSITTQPVFLYPPTNLNVVLNNTNAVTLTWQDNSSQETGFILERAIGTGSFVVIDTLIANTVTKIDSNLLDTTYYTYRLSCYNDTSNSWYSNTAQIVTMSATAPPPVVTTPVPRNNELYVNQNIILRWKQGLNTLSYDVYFDTTNPPPFVGNFSAPKFTPPAIEKGTTYYWRINAVNDNGVTEGPVWSFTSKTDLSPQMVARWSFDEDSGSVVQDIGPFINPGSFASFTQNPRVVGYLGGAINFNGQQGYIRVPHNGSIDFGKESFSVSYWLKVGTLSGVSMYIVHKGSTVRDTVTGTSGKWFGFEIKNNSFRWNVDDDVVKTTASIATIDTLLKTQWNHIVGLRDSTTKQMRLYVNGVLRSTQVDATGDISENEDLTIGSATAATAILAGTADDLRFYNYALSDGEIQTLANQPSTGIEYRSIVPTQFGLEQNYPNPFNPTTVISYQLSASSSVDLRVYDILGREVASLVHGMQVAGKYTVSFDASRLSSGMYIYRLVAGQFSVSRKMLLMK